MDHAHPELAPSCGKNCRHCAGAKFATWYWKRSVKKGGGRITHDNSSLLQVGSFRKMIGEKKCFNYHSSKASSVDIPTIYLITPTYTRPTQKADLIRLSQTLMLVPSIHWIVVEDSTSKTALVTKLLLESGIPHSQLNVRTPKELRSDPKQPRWKKPRGVLQRNLGLEWLRKNLSNLYRKGVVYFADDDNTYHVQLFEEVSNLSSLCALALFFRH